MSIHNNPGTMLKALQAMYDGLINDPPPGVTQITAGGKVSTIAQLSQEILDYATVYKAADDAGIQHDLTIIARNAIAPTALSRFEEIRASLKATLGKKSPVLIKFGVTPDLTPAPLTVDQKKVKVARAKATRVARHTLGAKQKKAVKGQVPPDK